MRLFLFGPLSTRSAQKSFAAKISVGKWRIETHSLISDLYSQAVNKTCDALMRSSRFCGIICLDAVAGGGRLSSLN
jgi:hypothetical protein